MEWPTYDEQLSAVSIPVDVLSMIPQELMENSFLMPLSFDKSTGCLTVVTSKYTDAFADITSILTVISTHTPDVKDIKLLSVSYENFAAGYNSHFKQQFTPTMTAVDEQSEVDTSKVTSEQTKLADNILRMGIDANASDIHITPVKEGPAKVEFRVDGKIRDSGIMLSREDSVTICNIYKRNAGLEVNNLIGQDGRFTFLGRDFRLSTQPYGGDNVRNKIVLRIIGFSNNVIPLDKLSFKKEEIAQLKEIIHKPNGIMLVCGPTGEGKSTTLYSCLQELVDTTNNIIVTVEDPIEKYINGIGQTQVRIAESERNSLTFSKALRSMLRQDPNVIMVGEIRDGETALVAVQASQTGHLILSTLHVRNSISVFRRLADMGANISGFAEQIVGITSQRLLSLNCPHCRKRVVSELNHRLRKKDLDMLEWGVDDEGREGYITYESKGCDKCGHTGFIGRVPLIEIIVFDNYLRDYFAEAHGLIDIEKYLRKNLGFRSLWDKGMERVVDGSLSLEELIDTIEPDVDIDLDNVPAAGAKSNAVAEVPVKVQEEDVSVPPVQNEIPVVPAGTFEDKAGKTGKAGIVFNAGPAKEEKVTVPDVVPVAVSESVPEAKLLETPETGAGVKSFGFIPKEAGEADAEAGTVKEEKVAAFDIAPEAELLETQETAAKTKAFEAVKDEKPDVPKAGSDTSYGINLEPGPGSEDGDK